MNITVDHRAVAPRQGRVVPGQPGPDFATTGEVPYISLKNVPLSEGLDALLRPLNLAYSVEDGFLWVSSPERIAHETFNAPDVSHAEPALVEALQAPHDFECEKTPLPETLAAMAKLAEVSIKADPSDARLAAATVDYYAVKDLPLGTALSILVRGHDLAFVASGRDIIVTTPARAHANSPAQ